MCGMFGRQPEVLIHIHPPDPPSHRSFCDARRSQKPIAGLKHLIRLAYLVSKSTYVNGRDRICTFSGLANPSAQ